TLRRAVSENDVGFAPEAVESQARAAAAAFESFFASPRDLGASLPVDLLSPSVSREETFERLVQLRDRRPAGDRAVDLTIYDAGGEALAWVGETSVLDSLGGPLESRA